MNVLLVTEWDKDVFKCGEVVRELRERGFRARIMHDAKPAAKHRLWSLGLPTKVISMFPLKHFLPEWADIWQQMNYTKIEEYQVLERAGIPIPKWVPIYPDEKPDLSDLEDYVVVKPAWSGRGACISVMKKDKVVYHPIRTDAMYGDLSPALIAQEYIHTGAWPTCYRVGTIFGEPYYTLRSTASGSRAPFIGSMFDANFFSGKSIVATARGCVRDDEVPRDVIELAKQAHEAFPDIPILGVDLVRDIRTNQLYVLEVNACGRTYQLDDEYIERNRKEFGIDIIGQFGGIKAVVRGIMNKIKSEELEGASV